MIPDSFIQELKYNCDIEQVISSYVNIKRRGRNLVGLCPFHSEKTPSFTVYPDSQSFYCFGCGAGGDVITFIKKIENLEYMEALRFLAKRANMELPEDVEGDKTARLRTRVLEINRKLARFYHEQLISPVGREALEYLRSRGIKDRTIRHFGLGFAPPGWDNARNFLRQEGYTYEEMLAAAVVLRGKNDSVYDQFRERVIFPIIDIRGNVIAFGARTMQGGPKYLNSSDTIAYKKSRNLFALNFAKASKQEGLILAEGYMDVIALHQAGFDNAVATLGTALTSEQTRLISQYTSNVVIAYDSDGAGQAATKRAINLFSDVGVHVKVLTVQDAKDPDEFIKKFGAKRFQMLMDGSSNAIEYELSKIGNQYDFTTDDGKVSYFKEAANLLASIYNPIERDVYASRVAHDLGVSKEAFLSQIQSVIKRRQQREKKKDTLKIAVAEPKGAPVNPERGKNLKAAVIEERILAILLKNPDYFMGISHKLKEEDFVTQCNRKVYAILSERLKEQKPVDLSFLSGLFDEQEMARITGLLVSISGMQFSPEDLEEYVSSLHAVREEKKPQDVAGMTVEELEEYRKLLAAKKK
ncbi:DNA primase [Zongyangia hominis]|uniref:DNA primase n=1 Tax=Zongyangia hominis TaxID=2763677 RepID=A0A926E7Q3_9FIRM|nr:DNA primase [Zongyangia hominis]MBC8569390.1 DNA primase [Zongyangia hominis]